MSINRATINISDDDIENANPDDSSSGSTSTEGEYADTTEADNEHLAYLRANFNGRYFDWGREDIQNEDMRSVISEDYINVTTDPELTEHLRIINFHSHSTYLDSDPPHFGIYPLFTRPVHIEKVTQVDDTDVYKCNVAFQVSELDVKEFQVHKSHGLWLVHLSGDDKPSSIQLKSNTTVLDNQTMFMYIADLVIVHVIPRGADPPIWLNIVGVAPAIDESLVKIVGEGYIVKPKETDVLKHIFPTELPNKVAITYIGSIKQYLKGARMLTLPERPSDLPREADYNVSMLYECIYVFAYLYSAYQPNQDLNAKYREFLNMKEPSMLMAVGGPGTGKTSTSAKAIIACLANYNDSERPIHLVTAPSNAAADVMYLKLLEAASQVSSVRIKIVRVGDMRKFSLAARSASIRDEIEYYEALGPGTVSSARRIYLQQADIIVVTLGSVQCKELTYIRTTLKSKVLVVDECGQAKFDEIMLPMYITSLRKMFFIGDPKQLGPVLKWHGFFNYQSKDTSIFVKFFTDLNKYSPNAIFEIKEQRRMRRFVAETVNMISYRSSELITGTSGNWTKTLNLPELIVFSGRSWFEQHATQTLSFENPNEFAFAINLLEASMKQAGFNWQTKSWPAHVVRLSYGIISLYRGQYTLFNRKIQQLGLKDYVKVSTVDMMQGSEVDVAIVSAVRASQEHAGVGFANDQKRLNVALSRGACCYVLAKVDDFSTAPGWNILFRQASSKKRLFSNADQLNNPDQLLGLLNHLSQPGQRIYDGHPTEGNGQAAQVTSKTNRPVFISCTNSADNGDINLAALHLINGGNPYKIFQAKLFDVTVE
ncbi:hypothetical protein TYRP_000933 [Tyrophagus putrescentiae]|nr:hypothetical protein TYRP_000933 [Tyrophagus putrescentiae]